MAEVDPVATIERRVPRWRSRRALVPISALVLVGAGLGAWRAADHGGELSGPASGGWNTATLPHIATARATYLYATDELSNGTGWAVGSWSAGGINQTAAEHWDGHQWTVVPTPNPKGEDDELFGVSALSATDAWAVGFDAGVASSSQGGAAVNSDTSLIEHWDGTHWRALEPPALPTLHAYEVALHAVAAVSPTNAWAAGFADYKGLIEHWDGGRWSVSPFPAPKTSSAEDSSAIFGLAAVSATDVWAVGSSSFAHKESCLLEHWDGEAWSAVTCPEPAGTGDAKLDSITEISPNDLWAVGFYTTGNTGSNKNSYALTEHFDGTAWKVVPTPHLAPGPRPLGGYSDELTAVAGRASEDVYAAGSSNRLIHWDGKRWTVQSAQSPGQVEGMASIPGGGVWAVGERLVGSTTQPFVVTRSAS